MIRILANMSINPMVGSSLACSTPAFYENQQNAEIQYKVINKLDENNKVRIYYIARFTSL